MVPGRKGSTVPPFAPSGPLPVESIIRLTSRFPTRTTAKYGRPFFGAQACASNRDQNYAQSRQQVASAQRVAFAARGHCQGREGSRPGRLSRDGFRGGQGRPEGHPAQEHRQPLQVPPQQTGEGRGRGEVIIVPSQKIKAGQVPAFSCLPTQLSTFACD